MREISELEFILAILLGMGTVGIANEMINAGVEKERIRKGYVIQERNVIGNLTPEKFYEISGKRFYIEIDGKPVEKYFPAKK